MLLHDDEADPEVGVTCSAGVDREDCLSGVPALSGAYPSAMGS
jgi:hypothetical protein